MKQWYCAIQGQRYGPVAEDVLRQWIREGRVTAADLVWCEGMANWQTAGQVFGDVFAAGAAGAPGAPGGYWQPLRGLATAPPPGGTDSTTPIGHLKAQALACLTGRWGLAIGFCLLWFLVHLGIGMVCGLVETISPLLGRGFQFVVQLILDGPFALGAAVFFLAYARRSQADVGMLFIGFKHFAHAVAANVLMTIFILGWLLLFASVGIVIFIAGLKMRSEELAILGSVLMLPGLIAAVVAALAYAQTYYILADDFQVGPLDAIRRSKVLMRGRKGKLFLLGLSFIGWVLLCILTLCIGFLWLAPYIACAHARFYDDLQPPVQAPRYGGPQYGAPQYGGAQGTC